MKLLLPIFIIYVSSSLAQDIQESNKKVIVKSYPKKVQPGLFQINDSGKYVKPPQSKNKANEKPYTVFSKVFPNVEKSDNLQIVPDSPYFPVETPLPAQLIRVKKVLPEYTGHTLRRKRSPEGEPSVKKAKFAPTLQGGKPNAGKKLKAGAKKRKVSASAKKKRELGQGDAEKKGPHAGKPKRGQRHHHKKIKRGHKKQRAGGKGQKKSKANKAKKLNDPKKPAQHKPPGAKLKSRRGKANARRLIAGRDAMIEEHPHVVSIQKSGQHWCAGALLNPTLVITTANCMWRANRVSKMRVRVGSRHTDRGGQTAKIQEVMKHPNWKIRKNPDNDVALILLDRKIKFSHSTHGVDLPNRMMLPAFEDAWITSWGSERRDGIYDPRGMSLQVYHARLMDNDKCNNVTQRFGVTVTENFFCLTQTGRRAPCTRDTGAPAVSDGVLWGLASWGIRKLCGTERFPAVFSYVGSHSNMEFITNASRNLMSDSRYYPFPDKYPRNNKAIIYDVPKAE